MSSEYTVKSENDGTFTVMKGAKKVLDKMNAVGAKKLAAELSLKASKTKLINIIVLDQSKSRVFTTFVPNTTIGDFDNDVDDCLREHFGTKLSQCSYMEIPHDFSVDDIESFNLIPSHS